MLLVFGTESSAIRHGYGNEVTYLNVNDAMNVVAHRRPIKYAKEN